MEASVETSLATLHAAVTVLAQGSFEGFDFTEVTLVRTELGLEYGQVGLIGSLLVSGPGGSCWHATPAPFPFRLNNEERRVYAPPSRTGLSWLLSCP